MFKYFYLISLVEGKMLTLLMIAYKFLDNVLVAISYYIGHEKDFTGEFPFRSLVCATAACMLASEICAIRKKRTISPAKSAKYSNKQHEKNGHIQPYSVFKTQSDICLQCPDHMHYKNLPENSDRSPL